MAVNFVKFERGLKSVYTTKKNAGRLDENTLYFVYESASATSGELYLGSKLIGGTSIGAITGLDDLADVNLQDSTLIDGMILHYDITSQTWVPISINTAIEDAKNAGANVGGADVTVGNTNANETVAQALARLAPNPTEGDIAVISGSPWVYSGANWVSLDDPSLNTRVTTLETNVATLRTDLNAVDGKIAGAIATANHLQYRVLTLDEVLNVNILDNQDELTRTVFLVPKADSGQNDHYDEYMYVSGSGFEKLGSWSADLNNYITTTAYNTRVGNLETRVSNLEAITGNYVLKTTYDSQVGTLSDFTDLGTFYQTNSILNASGTTTASTIVDGVLDIYDRLTWSELSNS